MPKYFADYDTIVHFIDQQTLLREHGGIPHGGFVIRSGRTGFEGRSKQLMEFSLKLNSNPEFTSSVLVACARAVFRLAKEGQSGCKTMLDLPPAYLSAKTAEELRSKPAVGAKERRRVRETADQTALFLLAGQL